MQEQPLQGVRQIYLLNLNVVLGVCFALLATRDYQILDDPTSIPKPIEFILGSLVSLGVLLITVVELYWFLRTIVRTVLIVDLSGPLLLGGLQAASIAFLPDLAWGRPNQQWWWYLQAAYSLAGFLSLLICWRYRRNRENSQDRLARIETGIKANLGASGAIAVIFILGGFRPAWLYGMFPNYSLFALLMFFVFLTFIAASLLHIIGTLYPESD